MQAFTGPLGIPRRDGAAHKARVGRVLVVGGSVGMAGAPALAALGALRAGAGLVNAAVPSTVQPTVAGFRPEWMTTPLGPDTADALGGRAVAAVVEMSASWDAVVLGPGAGRRRATVDAVRALVADLPSALVLDADGLFAFDADTPMPPRDAFTVITPHEGEAARLLGVSSDDVRGDRERAVTTLCETTGAAVVLKGPQTLVCDGQRLYRNDTGNPILAAGGTGDVLAGICAALVAAAVRDGRDPFSAVCAAVHVHGRAGDALAEPVDRGVLASEIADAVPAALAHLLEPNA